jgi:hypothetical protein
MSVSCLRGLLLLLLLPSAFGPAQAGDDGRVYRIGKITIIRREVFSPDDSTGSHWILDAANGLHVVTKENRIRSRLLFKEGDVYDGAVLDESARILRSMAIIGDVGIRPDTLPDGLVDVTVTTADRWSLGANASFKRDGGITAFGLSASEDNFLGNAQSFSVGYNYSNERERPHGYDVAFTDPHLFDEWLNLRAQYISNEFLDIKTLLLERPLYSDASRWSAGVYLDDGRSRVRTFTDGVLDTQYDIRQENQRFWGVIASAGMPRLLFGPSYVRTRSGSDSGTARSWDNLDLVSLSLGVIDRTYFTSRYVDNFGRTEDVPLGYQANVMFGWNAHRPTGDSPRQYFRALWQHALLPAGRWFLEYTAMATGYPAGEVVRDATVSLTVLQHVPLAERHLLAFRGSVVVGENWSPGTQLVLGSPTGLRGYPAYALSGNRQVLANLEHRFFSDLSFWIFRFGTALFVDAGTVWNEGERLASQRIRTAAGFGLRIENSKRAGSGVIRVDVAFNFEERRFAQVIISSDQLFHAFRRIEYLPPIEIP